MAISDEVRRKFIESYSGGGLEVLSDTGWKPIEKIHKTELYDIWQLVTTGHSLKCADNHIVFIETEYGMDEIFVKDLKIGDKIHTDTGFESVVDIFNTNSSTNMYDIELDDENHRYFTDGILSHNSTTTRAFLLWQALFTKDVTIAILANKLALAMEQLQQLKESYAMLPYWMQPGLRQWNKKTIQLAHNTRVMCAATSPDGIRGLAVNILYIDEFAFIPHYIANEFIASIFPTISSGNSTKIFITSTPNGLNMFHEMWDKAIKGKTHKDWNGFIAKEIPWNAVPGRDEKWAQQQIKQIGQIRFNQEFLCIGYNETITIKNKLNGIRETLSIGSLFDRLSDNQNIFISHNDLYDVLTSTDFKPFMGIVKHENKNSVTLILSDKGKFTCAPDHKIKTLYGFVPAQDCVGLFLIERDVYVTNIVYNSSTEPLFDLLEVENHEYISSNIVSHNCDFVGSVSTLIDYTFLKSMRAEEPMELPNLPDFVKIYDLPKSIDLLEVKNWQYIACLDTGYGVRADSSVLKIYLVVSNITMHLVAQMAANDMEVNDFCDAANQLLANYHNPNLIIEMNGPGATAMSYFYSVVEYENLVHFDPRGRLKGLWATDKLKNAAVTMLKSYIQRKLIKDYDADTLVELYSFGKVSKEKWGAMGGNHDDHVMAMLWCIYYVNSPLFYGNIVEANVAGSKNKDLILQTDDSLNEEIEAMTLMRDKNFHDSEMEKAVNHNPYDRDFESINKPRKIMGEDDDDESFAVGGFRS